MRKIGRTHLATLVQAFGDVAIGGDHPAVALTQTVDPLTLIDVTRRCVEVSAIAVRLVSLPLAIVLVAAALRAEVLALAMVAAVLPCASETRPLTER
jgi:hypothetical protein